MRNALTDSMVERLRMFVDSMINTVGNETTGELAENARLAGKEAAHEMAKTPAPRGGIISTLAAGRDQSDPPPIKVMREKVVTATQKPRGRTAICYKTRDRVIVRGRDLCRDLIGKVGFAEFFLFLLTGDQPSPILVKLVEASMVAIAEHGLVPSVQSARMTLHAAPEALQGAVAAGLLGAGSAMFGTAENAGRVLAGIVAEVKTRNKPLQQAVSEKLRQIRQARQPLPGFGHRTHANGDPRAARLLDYADELGAGGAHCAALREMARQAKAVFGRKLIPNIQGAIPAVLLDAGFPGSVLRGIPIVARAAGLIAHLAEESLRPISSELWYSAEAAIDYDGVPAS